MTSGYISIPRSLLDDPLWVDMPHGYQHVFMVLLQHVCFRPRKFDDYGMIIELQPGQICISERGLLKLCNKYTTYNDVQRGLEKFVLYNFVMRKVMHKRSVITITHTDTYDLIKKASDANWMQTGCNHKEEGKKENKKQPPLSPPKKSASQNRKSGGGGIFFDHEARKFQNADEDFLAKMRIIFPGVDINHELQLMCLWLADHPDYKGTQPFVTKWLTKCKPIVKPNQDEPVISPEQADLMKYLQRQKA